MPNGLGWKQKWAYGVGDLSFSTLNTIKSVFFALFLTDVVGLDPVIAAVIFFVGHSWDYINDPLVGYLTDKTRSRWGRRRPFLLFGTLPFVLVFVLLWWIPPFSSPWALGAYYLFVYALFDTVGTFVYMPFYALTPELTADYDERTSLTGIRMFFSILGGLIAFTVPFMIVDKFVPSNQTKILIMGMVFAFISAIPLFITFFGTRENPQNFHSQPKFNWLRSFKVAWQNKPFVFGLFMFMFNGITMHIVQVILLYYLKYVVQREPEQDLIMGVIFVVAMAILPLWNWLSLKTNKRLAYIYGASFVAAVFVVMSGLTPATPLWVLLFLCVLAGVGISAMHVLPWAMLPDAIEVGELQSGERNEGIFYSLITLGEKVAISLATPMVMLILKASGYQEGGVDQTASAINGIRFAAGPLLAITLGLGIIFTILYPIGRENYNEIRGKLEARRSRIQEEA